MCPFPLDDLVHLVDMGQVWVACDEDDVPVGMVIASVREGAAYVEEMDVMPSYGRRGVGTLLLTTACRMGSVEWSRWHHPLDLPRRGLEWSLYRKNGFRDLEPARIDCRAW